RSPSARRTDIRKATITHAAAGTAAPSRPPIPYPASRTRAKTSATSTIDATGTGPAVQFCAKDPTTPNAAPSSARAAYAAPDTIASSTRPCGAGAAVAPAGGPSFARRTRFSSSSMSTPASVPVGVPEPPRSGAGKGRSGGRVVGEAGEQVLLAAPGAERPQLTGLQDVVLGAERLLPQVVRQRVERADLVGRHGDLGAVGAQRRDLGRQVGAGVHGRGDLAVGDAGAQLVRPGDAGERQLLLPHHRDRAGEHGARGGVGVELGDPPRLRAVLVGGVGRQLERPPRDAVRLDVVGVPVVAPLVVGDEHVG